MGSDPPLIPRISNQLSPKVNLSAMSGLIMKKRRRTLLQNSLVIYSRSVWIVNVLKVKNVSTPPVAFFPEVNALPVLERSTARIWVRKERQHVKQGGANLVRR